MNKLQLILLMIAVIVIIMGAVVLNTEAAYTKMPGGFNTFTSEESLISLAKCEDINCNLWYGCTATCIYNGVRYYVHGPAVCGSGNQPHWCV